MVVLPLLILTCLLVERVYRAGRDKLLSYGWFEWAMGYVFHIRERLVEYKNGALAIIRTALAHVGL
ncbi:hypothetical protein HFN89_06830 [Rhizobium laguerreae]|nr:hypothetical protein [Rhizobium laguerreae]